MSSQQDTLKTRSKSFGKQSNLPVFEYLERRKSCYCSDCGKMGQFQLHNAHLSTLKEINLKKQVLNRRKPSLCDEIRTEIPSELSLLDSENGRFFRYSNRSISIFNKSLKPFIFIEQQIGDTNTRIKRRSCECSECGCLTMLQKKYEDIALRKREKKMKQFIIRKHNNSHQFGSKDYMASQKQIKIKKSIISSPQSQRSLQMKQLDSSRRTKDINKLITNRISTKDLEQPKQNQTGKYSIFNSCRQLDSPNLVQSKSQKQIIANHKPAMSFSTIAHSKWKPYKNTSDFS